MQKNQQTKCFQDDFNVIMWECLFEENHCERRMKREKRKKSVQCSQYE